MASPRLVSSTAILRAAGLLALSPFWRFGVRVNLTPVYGGVPASRFQTPVACVAPALALIIVALLPQSPAAARSAFAQVVATWISLAAATTAVALHFYLYTVARTLGPDHGPILTTLIVWLPVSLLSFIASLVPLADAPALLAVLVVAGNALDWGVSHMLDAIEPMLSSLLTRWGLLVTGVVLYAVLFPARKRILPLLALGTLFTFQNPHSPFGVSRLTSTLDAHGFKVLDRADSITGHVAVVESTRGGFRALRCDHSLLGGEWLLTPASRAHGMVVPEPIYPVFTTLEAVRLMDPLPESTAGPRSALVIGLGAGTCPAALAKHGINTTAVELDPVVTQFARRYFDLPVSLTVFDEDALQFVDRIQGQQFDFVVHDVFTGGAEPVPLFEQGFLRKLAALLKPAGAVAINYAGDLDRAETRQAIREISQVFGGNCRAFRDNAPDENGGTDDDFANVSLFCKIAGQAWAFREPVEADYLGSMSRREHLVPRLEVQLDGDAKEDLGGGSGAASVASACNHWRIMRKVLPDVVWETW